MTQPKALIRLGIDDGPATTSLKNLVGSFGNAAVGINQGLELVGKGVGFITDAARLAITTMAVATTAAVGLGDAVAEVSTIADEAQFPIATIRDISLDLAKTYGSEAQGNAKALYQTISAGVTDAARATDLLNVASEFAIGGVTDLTISVDGLTNVVNAYAADGLTARDAADTLFVAVRDGKTTVEELATSMGQVSPIAAQLGVDFPDLAAAIATITTNGVATAEAVTQVRSALVAVAKQTEKAQAVAKDLGLDFSLTALRAKGLRDFMHDVVVESGATEEQLVKLFGRVEGLAGALSLTANEGKKFDLILGDMERRSGSTRDAFEKVSASLGFQIRRFESLRDASRIALGEMVSGSNEAIAGLTDLNEIQVKVIDLLGSPEAHRIVDEFFGSLREGLREVIAAAVELDRIWHTEFGGTGLDGQGKDAIRFSLDQFSEFGDVVREGVVSGLTLGLFGGDYQEEWDEFLTSLDGPADSAFRDMGIGLRGELEDAVSGGILAGLEKAKNEGAKFKQVRFTPEQEKPAPRGSRGDFDKWLGENVEAGAHEFGPAPSTQQQRDLQLAEGSLVHLGDAAEREMARLNRTLNPGKLISFNIVGSIEEGLAGGVEAFEDGGRALAEAATTEVDRVAMAIKPGAQMIATSLAGGVATGIQQMIAEFRSGADELDVVRGFFGDIIVQLGSMLVQMGVTALAMAPFGAIPAFWPLVGGPGVSAAVGAGALVVGTGLIAAGMAMGGSGGASTTGASSAGGGGGAAVGGSPPRSSTVLPGLEDLFRGGGAGAGGVTINVNVQGGVGNPRRFGADVVDAAREALTLEPFGPPGLGW